MDDYYKSLIIGRSGILYAANGLAHCKVTTTVSAVWESAMTLFRSARVHGIRWSVAHLLMFCMPRLTIILAPHLGIIAFTLIVPRPHNRRLRHKSVFAVQTRSMQHLHQRNGQMIPRRECAMQHTFRPQHNGLFSLLTLQEQNLFLGSLAGGSHRKHPNFTMISGLDPSSFSLNRTSFIMEVVCTHMCATASLCLGLGWYIGA